MRKVIICVLSIAQANLLQVALAQSISLTPNQSVNIRNTCATKKIDLFSGTTKLDSYTVASDALSFKINLGQYAKFGKLFTVYCDSSQIANLRLVDSSIAAVFKSSYLSYRSGNKIYFPNIYLSSGKILKVNGEDKIIYIDSAGKYILDPERSINIEGAEFYDPERGVTFNLSENNDRQVAIASREEYDNLGALIAAYGKIKDVDQIKDWTNVSMSKEFSLPRPINQNNNICGSNIYILRNLTQRQFSSLTNVSLVSPIPVNPTGSLWPTGTVDLSQLTVAKPYSDVVSLSNLKNRHAKYAKNKVTVHILDTASQYSDDYSVSFGQVIKYGHGSIIGKLIQEMIDKSGFDKYLRLDYIDVCDSYNCNPMVVSKKICEVAKNARDSSDELHIVSLSMSSVDPQDFLRLAIMDAVRAGVSVVMSSGNKTTCNGYNTGTPVVKCLLYPVDSFNISALSDKIDRKTYVKTLNSSGVDTVNLYSRGIYSVASMNNGLPDQYINRERPFGTWSGVYTRSNIPNIYAPSAYYDVDNRSLYAGTSFSAGYFAAALGMYRACDRQKRVGPSIYSDDWAQQLSNTPSLALDVDKMLAGICY